MMNILTQEEINRINDLCEQYNIENYTINSDGSIDVDGHVYLYGNGLTILPLRFNVVSGDFDCSYNELTSLEGCPKEVGGGFYCRFNQLTSLEFSPESVGGDFYCSFNKLTSLEFSPKSVGGNFDCNFNNLPNHFTKLYNKLKSEEIKIFVKYHHHMRIWDDGYDQEEAQLLYDDIKDGLL